MRPTLRRGFADLRHHLRCHPLGGVEVGIGIAVIHEQHIDVGRIRRRRRAAPSDHGKRTANRAISAFECGFGERRESGPTASVGAKPEIAAGDAQQLPALEPA
jgi:hypothetical protein